MIMKDFLFKVKLKLPHYKEKIIKSMDVLLIYQGLLFLVAPNALNQILLIAFVIIFILLALKKI